MYLFNILILYCFSINMLHIGMCAVRLFEAIWAHPRKRCAYDPAFEQADAHPSLRNHRRYAQVGGFISS